MKVDPEQARRAGAALRQGCPAGSALRVPRAQRHRLLPIAISWLVLFALGWGAALAAGAGTTGAVQFGASVLVWGGFVRGVVVFHITMSVNSITHLWGYRSYQTNDNSKNNVFIGILAPARAGTTIITPILVPPATAGAGGSSTSPGSSSACSNGPALHGTSSCRRHTLPRRRPVK